MQKIVFRKGTHSLNPDPHFNFQLNRVIQWDVGRLEDVQPISQRIHTNADWKRELIARSVGLRSKSTVGYYMNRPKSQGRISSLPEAAQNSASVRAQLSADVPLRRVHLEVEEGGSISSDCRIENKENGEQTVVVEGVLDASQLKREVGCVVHCAVEEE